MRIILPRKDKYLVQTRSQVRSSGIRLPEIHGVNKGINPHLKPERQRPLPTLPTQSIPPTHTTQPFDKGPPTHPIPKLRIGQGRAGLRKKGQSTSANSITPSTACSANNRA